MITSKILNYLDRLGFSKTESKIYTSLLKSGPMTVAEIAEAVKINRTATYKHIESLFKKGVLTKIKGASNKIASNPPEHLHYLVENKLIEVRQLKENLPSIINMLQTTSPIPEFQTKSEIKYYKGKTSVKIIYEECLKSLKIRAYYNPDDLINIFPENIELFENTIVSKPEMLVLEITQKSSLIQKEFINLKDTKRHLYKSLPDDIKLTANDILIYDNKVAIINIGDKNNITGVVISNKDYFNNSVQLFDLLWRMLPDPKISQK